MKIPQTQLQNIDSEINIVIKKSRKLLKKNKRTNNKITEQTQGQIDDYTDSIQDTHQSVSDNTQNQTNTIGQIQDRNQQNNKNQQQKDKINKIETNVNSQKNKQIDDKIQTEEQNKKAVKKPINILQQSFENWFQNEIKQIYNQLKVPQILQAKKMFIKYMFKKYYGTQKQKQRQNQQQNEQKDQNKNNIKQEQSINHNDNFDKKQKFTFINRSEQVDQLNQIMVERIIKQNSQIIRQQVRWQQADQCPPDQKITHQRKGQQLLLSFIYQGYGMANFKKFIVKKFLNKQKDWQMLFPLVRDHQYYKRQSRPLARQGFRQLQHFLRRYNAFPNETNGYVDIKDAQVKWYLTSLMHCRRQFQPQICDLFLRLMAHAFNIQKSNDPQKKQIGLNIKEAQLLYTKIIEKFYQNQRAAPANQIQSLQKYYENFTKKKQAIKYAPIDPLAKQSIPDRSMIPNKIKDKLIQVFENNKIKQQPSIVVENTPLKAQLQTLYIDYHLKGKCLSQITDLLSKHVGKQLDDSQTRCLHQTCIRNALQHAKVIQRKFLKSPFYLNDYLSINSQPNAQFFLKTIGLNYNIKLLTWSSQFEDVRKRLFLIFKQKMDGEQEIIELWSLLSEALKRFRECREKGFAVMSQGSEFIIKKRIGAELDLKGNECLNIRNNSMRQNIIGDKYKQMRNKGCDLLKNNKGEQGGIRQVNDDNNLIDINKEIVQINNNRRGLKLKCRQYREGFIDENRMGYKSDNNNDDDNNNDNNGYSCQRIKRKNLHNNSCIQKRQMIGYDDKYRINNMSGYQMYGYNNNNELNRLISDNKQRQYNEYGQNLQRDLMDLNNQHKYINQLNNQHKYINNRLNNTDINNRQNKKDMQQYKKINLTFNNNNNLYPLNRQYDTMNEVNKQYHKMNVGNRQYKTNEDNQYIPNQYYQQKFKYQSPHYYQQKQIINYQQNQLINNKINYPIHSHINYHINTSQFNHSNLNQHHTPYYQYHQQQQYQQNIFNYKNNLKNYNHHKLNNHNNKFNNQCNNQQISNTQYNNSNISSYDNNKISQYDNNMNQSKNLNQIPQMMINNRLRNSYYNLNQQPYPNINNNPIYLN